MLSSIKKLNFERSFPGACSVGTYFYFCVFMCVYMKLNLLALQLGNCHCPATHLASPPERTNLEWRVLEDSSIFHQYELFLIQHDINKQCDYGVEGSNPFYFVLQLFRAVAQSSTVSSIVMDLSNYNNSTYPVIQTTLAVVPSLITSLLKSVKYLLLGTSALVSFLHVAEGWCGQVLSTRIKLIKQWLSP